MYREPGWQSPYEIVKGVATGNKMQVAEATGTQSFLGILVIWCFVEATATLLVMVLWNQLVPNLSHHQLPGLSFIQTFMLRALCSMLLQSKSSKKESSS